DNLEEVELEDVEGCRQRCSPRQLLRKSPPSTPRRTPAAISVTTIANTEDACPKDTHVCHDCATESGSEAGGRVRHVMSSDTDAVTTVIDYTVVPLRSNHRRESTSGVRRRLGRERGQAQAQKGRGRGRGNERSRETEADSHDKEGLFEEGDSGDTIPLDHGVDRSHQERDGVHNSHLSSCEE
ncbi:unnamed protein product, partial [Choristocarpus tenellus]